MNFKDVDLGYFELSLKSSGLSLKLSTTICVGLPPRVSTDPTPDAIIEASESGKLWIAKAGSCRLDFRTAFVGLEHDDGDHQHISRLILESAVWTELGLELRETVKQDPESLPMGPYAAFHLHHSTITSVLAPPGTPYGTFQSMSCALEFDWTKKTSSSKDVLDRTTEAVRSHSYNTRSRIQQPGLADSSENESHQPSRHMGCFEPPWFQKPGDLPFEDFDEFNTSISVEDVSTLVTAALRRLLGVRRVLPGIRTTKSFQSPPLLDIAPAVWNMRYLELWKEQTSLIPSISSSIAQFAESRSDSLRHKVLSLGTVGSEEGRDTTSGSADGAQPGIQKRVWELCQSVVYVDAGRIATSAAKDTSLAATSQTFWDAGRTGAAMPKTFDEPARGCSFLDHHAPCIEDEYLPGQVGWALVPVPWSSDAAGVQHMGDLDLQRLGDENRTSESDAFAMQQALQLHPEQRPGENDFDAGHYVFLQHGFEVPGDHQVAARSDPHQMSQEAWALGQDGYFMPRGHLSTAVDDSGDWSSEAWQRDAFDDWVAQPHAQASVHDRGGQYVSHSDVVDDATRIENAAPGLLDTGEESLGPGLVCDEGLHRTSRKRVRVGWHGNVSKPGVRKTIKYEPIPEF